MVYPVRRRPITSRLYQLALYFYFMKANREAALKEVEAKRIALIEWFDDLSGGLRRWNPDHGPIPQQLFMALSRNDGVTTALCTADEKLHPFKPAKVMKMPKRQM